MADGPESDLAIVATQTRRRSARSVTRGNDVSSSEKMHRYIFKTNTKLILKC